VQTGNAVLQYIIIILIRIESNKECIF